MKEEYLSIDTITRLVELEKENKELKDRYEKCKKQKIKVEDACSNYKYRIDKATDFINKNKMICKKALEDGNLYEMVIPNVESEIQVYECLLEMLRGNNE